MLAGDSGACKGLRHCGYKAHGAHRLNMPIVSRGSLADRFSLAAVNTWVTHAR
jgi:hypothetical protein